MRNGAFTTGNITCNSSPVETRGTKFVPESVARLLENNGMPPALPGTAPPEQPDPILNVGHPNCVVFKVLTWVSVNFNCDVRATKFSPPSANAAIVTGPTTGTRYSRLPIKFVSPPGTVTRWIGIGIVTFPR